MRERERERERERGGWRERERVYACLTKKIYIKKLKLFRSIRSTAFNFTPTVLKFSEVLQNDIR